MKSDDRRNQIVTAAMRVVARDGAAAVTTRSIAREARVNLATLHALFGSKDALLLAVLERTTDLLVQALLPRTPRTHQSNGPSDPLAKTLTTLWALIDRDDRLPLVRCELQLSLQHRPACLQTVREQEGRYLEALAAIYRRAGTDPIAGISAEALAALVVAIVDGLVVHGSHKEGTDAPADRWAGAIRAIVDRITADAPRTTRTHDSGQPARQRIADCGSKEGY
jgi:AcrR family transcriptional regulator